MTQTFICILYILGLVSVCYGQEGYFQQEVNYDIEVTLDDIEHALEGKISIEYHNNSPNSLPFIYFHLWPNAYKTKNTAYAKQSLRIGETDFFFASPAAGGHISALDFSAGGISLNWDTEAGHPDIAKVHLPEPLASGEKIIIQTPFQVKLPHSFSRLGHDSTAYQLSQWYPKPAVYDHKGWHPMPYLDLGEFYSEFGSFDVKISLPENYVVGATGVLQTESEKAFLEARIASTNAQGQVGFSNDMDFPPSSSTLKTIRFTADQVHDFAWFADKRFHVQKGQVTLSDGHQVDLWAMFTNREAHLWNQAIRYLERSIRFYSEQVGPYPYPQVTAVESNLAAGGGMEYPMITVIAAAGSAQSLDRIITHEVGHNWFYGVLGNNERINAWMDEGINSYYESRYMDQYYEKPQVDVIPESFSNFVGNGAELNFDELFYLYLASRNLDQPPNGDANRFEKLNYYLGAYSKPSMAFNMLESYLGKNLFDRAMQRFYTEWAFRHPGPDDLRKVLEEETGRDLHWLFEGFLLSSQKMDYALINLEDQDTLTLTVKNKSTIAAPFSISGLRDDKIIHTQWFEGFQGQKEISFSEGDYDRVILDAEHLTLDINRRNNNLNLQGPFKRVEPLKLKFFGGVDNPRRSNLYWFPLLAWNNYDKAMLGMALYNRVVPAKPLEFALAPLYSFATKDLNGLAHLRYNWYPNNRAFKKITLGVGWKSFNSFYNASNDYYIGYRRLVPQLKVRLGQDPVKLLEQTVSFRTLLLWEDIAQFDTTGIYQGNSTGRSTINELAYEAERQSAVNPFRLRLALEQQQYTSFFGDKERYLKASLEWNGNYTYRANRHISFRIFAGYFFDNTRRTAGSVSNRNTRGTFALTYQGFNDYRYDEFFLGRSDNQGIWSQQVAIEGGGLKNAFGGSFGIGQSNDYIIAFNVAADLPQSLPLNLPLRPYFDMGFFHNARPTGSDDTFEDQFLWSGGLMLQFGRNLVPDGLLSIYFPLINSDNLKQVYNARSEGKYGARISFSLNLSRLDPWELVDRIRF